jgi:dipeptidyl aminopeptidase/acylaminoacyl peptidase
MRHTLRFPTSAVAAVVFLVCLSGPARATQPAGAQAQPFTAEDMLRVASISVQDVTEDGARVAVTVRRPVDNPTTDHRRYGDPTYLAPSRVTLQVFDTRTGAADTIFEELVNVRDASWSRDGRRLAILLGREADGPDAYPRTALYIWDADRRTLAEVPQKAPQPVAVNSTLTWTPDGSAIVVALRSPESDREARATFIRLTDGPIVEHKSSEPFLEWDLLNRSARTRALAALDPRTGAVRSLLPQGRITSYQVARDGSFLTVMEDVTEKTDYETIGGTDNDLKYVDARTGDTRLILPAKELKGLRLQWSDDGRWFAYARRGEVFVQSVDRDSKPRSLTPKPAGEKAEGDTTGPPRPETARPGEEQPQQESFTPLSFSRSGGKLLISSRKGWYVVNVADATRELIVPMEEDENRNPRLSAIAWVPDDSAILASWASREQWERGVVRIDLATKTLTPLVKDDGLYGGVRLSRDGSTFIYTASDGTRPPDLYANDARFAAPKRLSDANPWVATRHLPTAELVKYRDVDGKELNGVLRYPVGYEKGRAYPTIFELYETFFDNGFNARAAFLTSNGYAVFHPSVNLVVGRPGEAWVKGVTSAANRLIEMGIADPDRLGVHGTSYGGYATALLITQTDRFKAAINISGKVNMVSFYTDSPRLGVRNTHAPERSQDRIGGTLWEYPERYLEHSAVLRADRVTTPLLNITGDQDPNVPASQSREMYYALRRLGKDVEWVRYVNGGHRPPNSVEESIDFEQRILEWYDRHLKKDQKKPETTDQAARQPAPSGGQAIDDRTPRLGGRRAIGGQRRAAQDRAALGERLAPDRLHLQAQPDAREFDIEAVRQ